MKYFGTDGIRKKAEEFTPEFLQAIVKGLADYGQKNKGEGELRVLLGGDTRESSEWILRELEIALESLGVDYGNVGVLPTPAINYVFYEMGFDFAIDVTASHNPYTDNGIKIFERGEEGGRKLAAEGCEQIEMAIEAGEDYETVATNLREDLHEEAVLCYLEHLREKVGKVDFSGVRIGLDSANGATSEVAKRIFREFGATVEVICDDANYGQEINQGCGSTHLEKIQGLVKREGLELGAAFDGDGDRCLMIDEAGKVVDGDQILVVLTEYFGLKRLAVTVMANQGLMKWADETGVKLEITAVGDQSVYAAMKELGIKLGGEQSGHIILPGETMGDGILTALMMTKVMTETGKGLGGLTMAMTRFPQVILNMEATPEMKVALKESVESQKLLLEYNEKMREVEGRLLVRPSGTEQLIRVTMWGNDEEKIQALAEELVEKLKVTLK